MPRTLGDLAEVDVGMTEPDLVLDSLVRLGLVRQRDEAALVVRPVALVVERHETVALEVRNWDNGRVNWELLVVDTETVAVSVGVGEETRLEDGVG